MYAPHLRFKEETRPKPMNKNVDIEALINDRKAFNALVYTELPDALAELEKRRADAAFRGKVDDLLGGGAPPEFGSKPKAVLARHVITPNHEVIRFLNIPDSTGMEPLFFEYHKDKLIYKNPGKYRLAKLLFHAGFGKKGGAKTEQAAIIHLDASHGKEIASVSTHMGQSLVEFHHNLFLSKFPAFMEGLFDGSAWYAQNGGTPQAYYPRFLGLFLVNGILFENFLLDQKEILFTKEIFLPAFLEVERRTGKKPLIVALEPTEIEGDEFWLSYPHTFKETLDLRKPEEQE